MTFPGLLIILPPTIPTSTTLGGGGGQFVEVGTIPRSIRICVPNLVMIGPAVSPPILDRHTYTLLLDRLGICLNKLYLISPYITHPRNNFYCKHIHPVLSRSSIALFYLRDIVKTRYIS